MIEIEKKFLLSKADEARLIDGAEFITEKKFTDVYYDTDDYALTKNDTWLRSRDGRFELKVLTGESHQGRSVDQYKEIEDDKSIAQKLNIETDKPLAEALTAFGYKPFATIVTIRRKYKKDGFAIDLDAADFGYEIAEIELMVESKEGVPGAVQKIVSFAESHGLKVSPVNGKLVEYLKRFRKEHLEALEAAWGIKL
jgi:predicted adenylyl cyclase CyaB